MFLKALMRRSLAVTALAATLGALVAGNAAVAQEITAEKLKEALPQAEIDGKTYYFVEGDLRVEESELEAYARLLNEQFARYEQAKAGTLPAQGVGAPAPGQLIIAVGASGQFRVWRPGAVLKYCVLRKTFPNGPAGTQQYQAVVDQMAQATQDWQETCNIKFEHVSAKDNSTPGNSPPTGVLFTVRKVNAANGPIASAFFPGDAAARRHVLLFPSYFAGGGGFDTVGVLRHELGHVLGYRHEHIRSQAPAACRREALAGAIPVTAYDPRSVMHYFCGGAGTSHLRISPLDRIGAQSIYGPPADDAGALAGAPAGFAGPAEAPAATAAFCEHDNAFDRQVPEDGGETVEAPAGETPAGETPAGDAPAGETPAGDAPSN